MTQEVTELLEKRRWTGEEAGKAIIYSLIHSYKNSLEGKRDDGLFSALSLKHRTSDFANAEQLRRYNKYAVLSGWISQYQAVANAHIQQATGQLMLLEQIAETAYMVEEEILRMNAGHGETERSAPGRNATERIVSDRVGEPLSAICGAAQFTPKNPSFAENIARVDTARELLEDSIYWLHGYNTAVTLVAAHIGIPEFFIFSAEMDGINHSITRLNGIMRNVDLGVRTRRYGGFNESEANFVGRLLRPVEPDRLAPPKSAEKAAQAMLDDDMKAFEKQDGVFIGLLTERI